jgi:hypothetical protein
MAATAIHRLTLDPMLIYVLRWRPSWISDRHKKINFVEDLPMIIPGQFGVNCLSGFREEAFWPNCPVIVIGRFSTKFMFFLCRSKIQDVRHRNT